MKKIAKLLQIQIGSEAWVEMKDKAYIDAGRIPKDILSDAKLLPILPLLFRALRDEKPTARDTSRLIARLRKGT